MYKLCIRRTPTSTAFPLPIGFVICSVNLHKAHHQYAHCAAEHCSAEENEPTHYLQFQLSLSGTAATVFLAFFDFDVQQARTAMPEPTAAIAPAVMKIALIVFFFILFFLLYGFFGFCGHNTVQLGIRRELIRKGDNHVSVENQTFARTAVCNIRKLMR